MNQLRHLKVTLLFTYSGIDNPKIEPYPSHVAADSLKLMSAPLGFQVHDERHPHHANRHGRADIGWKETPAHD